MMIETKEDLQSLNKRRKALMVEVAQLKRHQENNLYRISQDVGTYLEDHAEKYFSLEGDFKDKTFAQRFDASLKAMVSPALSSLRYPS